MVGGQILKGVYGANALARVCVCVCVGREGVIAPTACEGCIKDFNWLIGVTQYRIICMLYIIMRLYSISAVINVYGSNRI